MVNSASQLALWGDKSMDLPRPVELPPPPPPAELGLCCRRCGASAFTTCWQTFANGTKHVRMDCGRCGAYVRYLKQQGAPEPKVQFAPADTPRNRLAPPTPADAWEWVGMIRLEDQVWRAVAKAPTLERCWDSLLTFGGEGDLLCMPSRRLPNASQPGDENG
jgi:hypothetical protein